MNKKIWFTTIATLVLVAIADLALAQEMGKQIAHLKVTVDTVWVIICAALVFFMNSGFALLEAGLCRSKNAVNILSKNVIVFGVAAGVRVSVGLCRASRGCVPGVGGVDVEGDSA